MAKKRTHASPAVAVPVLVRERLGWRQEALLVLMPTLTVLAVLGLVDALTRQRLLFASLVSSAFLIYLDPRHVANSVRTLTIAQLSAAIFGLAADVALGHGFIAAAAAVLATIATMVLLDAVHPPAIATSLAFALRSGGESNLAVFALAIGILLALVALERATHWLFTRLNDGENDSDRS